MTNPVSPRPKPIIGLVGGIGSGKSRVAAAFAEHGGRLIEADPIGHEALRQPEIKARVAARWPGVIAEDGEVSRRRLGQIVFADPAERLALQDLVYPWIGERVREAMVEADRDPTVAFTVLDAAVMLEAGWNDICDRLVYVHTPRSVRLRRLAAGRGWSAAEVAAREQVQLPLAVKAARADAAVDNAGPPEALARQVGDLLTQWQLLK
jgi:dephospho-CoA kinase